MDFFITEVGTVTDHAEYYVTNGLEMYSELSYLPSFWYACESFHGDAQDNLQNYICKI